MGNYKKGKFKLYGRVAVVTGAARGIGKQISLAYASEGVNIALVDINQDNLNNVLNEIDNNFNDVKVIGLKCDIGNISEVNETISKVLEEFRKIDFLVNNAGITFRSKIENLNISDWNKLMSVNLNGVLYCCKAVIPIMKRRGKGKIINSCSNMAYIPDVDMAAYCISKAGVEILTKVLASELAPYGIYVNAYSPRIIKTNMTEDLIKSRGKQKLKFISLKKFGEVEDVASLVLFLSSELSDYITGAIIPVNGGLL